MPTAEPIRHDYQSPRWSGEVLDCSMPMTLDTYSACSYRCLYCFSFNQRAIGVAAAGYLSNVVRSVSVRTIKRFFTDPPTSQFGAYIQARRMFQWGGLSDAFDEYERRFGITLELLRFFKEIRYPISFSTKGTWWTQDERYMELVRGSPEWHFKVSIITLDDEKARRVEVLAPTPTERLAAITTLARAGVGGVTLRLRPFILGLSSADFTDLIARAADAGADSVSTEFLCLETRNRKARARYDSMSRLLGYDLFKMYRKVGGTGYLRLNREIKRPYFDKMREVCEKHRLRLYVSDAHFKEICPNGSCCGLTTGHPYSRQQFTEALLYAKAHGRVRFSDVYNGPNFFGFLYRDAAGFNTASSEVRAKFREWSLKDWIRWHWNNVESLKSPARYFGGILRPVETDDEGNIVYEYVKGRE